MMMLETKIQEQHGSYSNLDHEEKLCFGDTWEWS